MPNVMCDVIIVFTKRGKREGLDGVWSRRTGMEIGGVSFFVCLELRGVYILESKKSG